MAQPIENARVIDALKKLSASSLGRRLAGGLIWTTFAGTVGRLLTLLGGIALARMLGKQGYGAFSMIQGTVGMFGALSGFGIGLTATKYIAEYRSNRREEAADVIALSSSVALVSGASVSLLLVALAGPLAGQALGAPELAMPVRIAALLLLLSTIGGAQSGVLSGFEAFRSIATVALIGGPLSLLSLVLGALYLGVNGAIWGLLIGQAATTALNHRAVTRVARQHGILLRLWGGKRLAGLLWRYSLPAALASMVVGPVSWVCSAILVNSEGGFGEVAILNAANQWLGLMLFIPGLLGQALIPLMSERLSRADALASRRLLLVSSGLNGAVAVMVLMVVWLMGPLIARAYGQGFESAQAVLNIALITGAVVAVQSPVGHVIAASGRMWTGFLLNIAWGATFILGTWLLAGRGALGVAHARLAAYVLTAACSGWYAWQILRSASAGKGSPASKHPEDVTVTIDLTT